ncbi:phage tail assembly protein [Sphingomonas sp.]|uniref:phage tail assembly protein n=1 Tax=Sphingomonas sp. TaxID=28214 RepID=UPI003F704582
MTDQLETAATPAPALDSTRFASVTLSSPIARGTTTIDTLTIRKPKAGELRGLTLQDLVGTDVTALLKIIPRISSPVLTQEETDNLEAEDLTEIGGTIRGFFMTSAEKKLIEAMIAEHQPKT